MEVRSAVQQVRDGFALTGVPIAPTVFVELVEALLIAADPPAPVPAMLSAFVSRIGLTHPNPGNDKDKMAYELLVIFASMMQHAEDMKKVRGGGDRGANSGVAAMLGIIARLGCYATDKAVQTAFVDALSRGVGNDKFNGLVTRLVWPVKSGEAIDITGLIPASVPSILPPAERPGDRKIVRKIDLLLQAEALKVKDNAGGIVIVPPMPSIFAKYYVKKNLNDPRDAASKAKEDLDQFPRAEQARQIRLVPRMCVIPRDGHSDASAWADLYDALDFAISRLPQLHAAPQPIAMPPPEEQRPDGETDLYEWENKRYDTEVPYRLADRNRRRR
jgi:hypothetical protein